MRCLASLVLALLALEAALALAPTFSMQEWVAVCPDPTSETVSSEERFQPCDNDKTCPTGTKCCFNMANSRTCMTPLMVPAPKAGQVQDTMIQTPFMESSKCSKDDDCANNKKCCSNMCAVKCTDPAAEDFLH